MKAKLFIVSIASIVLAGPIRAADAAAPATEDKEVLREAQASLVEIAKDMLEKAEDPKAQAALGAAITEMERSVKLLEEAKGAPDRLPAALAAQQAAYKKLLQLAAHVYQVQRQNSRESKGKQSGRERQFEQQLEQLEMKKQEDRYEKQSQASPTQTEEQKEQLAVLNRLKELAQRQQDLNERMKELQNALEAARTEEQKEDVRRQLKRLQEEERQMLADLDEMKQRMEQGENQSRMSDERRQLEQTRQQAERAAQSLEQNKASEALAAGSRAQRELEQMRDDFRKKTTKAFSEEMRQMREQTRDLSKNQEELGRQLDSINQDGSKKKSLADADQRTRITKQLEQQRKELNDVLDGMRRVSESAEAAEPLLARELYDALRKSAQNDTDQNLQMTQELLNRGYAKQATTFEQKARKEINDIRESVERAARGVLGDEAEALRTARSELDQLGEQLNREIARNSPALAEQMRRDAEEREARATAREQRKASSPGGDSKEASTNTVASAASGEKMADPKNNPSGTSSLGEAARSERKTQQNVPGQTPGEQANSSQKSGERSETSQTGKPGGEKPRQMAQAGQQTGDQPGSQAAQSGQRGGGQPTGEQKSASQSSRGGQPTSDQPGGEAPATTGKGNRPGARPDRANNLLDAGQRTQGGTVEGGGRANTGMVDVIRGEGYLQWSDRLRAVEEMIDRPELRTEAARIREIAKAMRVEFKRHSKEPQWDIVQSKISQPLAELRNRVSEELARLESKDALVPIDRDPVPGKFGELVRRYYEELGREK